MSSAYISKALTLKDFDSICRTCLGDEKLSPIVGTLIGDIKVEDLLEDTVKIEVDQIDFLPLNICENCLIGLYKIHEFKKLCHDNENTLKLLAQGVANEKTKTEEFPINTFIEENGECKYSIFEEHNYNKVEIDYDTSLSKEQILLNQSKEDKSQNTFKLSSQKSTELQEQNNIKEEFSDIAHLGTDEELLVKILPDRKNKKENNNVTLVKEANLSEELNTNIKAPIKGTRPNFKCRDCGYTTCSKEEVWLHYKSASHGRYRKQRCEICNKQVRRRLLAQHMRLHSKERPYKCDICPLSFKRKDNLGRHKMTHTGECPHVCNFCGRGFLQATSLQAHEKTHDTQENLDSVNMKITCNICGREFKFLHYFKSHLKKHINPEQARDKSEKKQEPCDHLCDICGRAFTTRNKLKDHQLRHGEKSFLCSECGKSFTTKTLLLIHVKIHRGEKPYMCMICKKRFAHASALEVHGLIHKGIKPHKCKYCSKSFTQQPHLINHLRTHSGEKPYTCTYCNKSFALKGNLTVHVRIHTGETPYVCQVCGKGFYDSSSMKKHRQRHKGEPLEEAEPDVKPHPQEDSEISVDNEL